MRRVKGSYYSIASLTLLIRHSKARKMLSAFPLMALAALVLPVASKPAPRTCDPKDAVCPTTLDVTQEETCALYLAPSDVPGVELGIYTAINVPHGTILGENDLFVPILDRLKTLPYRGQQYFLSWLGYVWPEHPDTFYPTYDAGSFPEVPASFYQVDEGLNGAEGTYFYDAEGLRVSAFAPGVASLANSDPDRVNLEQDRNAGGTYSFRAAVNIPAGSELFLDYGPRWNERYDEKQNSPDHYDTLEEHLGKIADKHLQSEHDKRNDRSRRRDTSEVQAKIKKAQKNDKPDEKKETVRTEKITRVTKEKKKIRKEVDSSQLTELPPVDTEQVEWLKENGLCIDNLRAGPSSVPEAGKGAFAKRSISKDSIIAPAPLLALKRGDLVIYETDATKNNIRDVLNFDKVVGKELLLNYCFGHKDSELLLVPYAPVVNFINHDAKEPNAEIRWPEKAAWYWDDEDEWIDWHPLDVLDESGKLTMEIVAIRDIAPGEEIFINYGRDWDEAWKTHVGDRSTFRHEIGVPNGFYPDGWKNQSVVYEIAPLETPLKPGEVSPLTWKHNGEPVDHSAFRVGLPKGFSAHFRDFSDQMGITSLYEQLLETDVLESNEWFTFETHGEEWFAHRFQSKAWNFNMHYIAAWDEAARVSLLRAMGSGGFDAVLEGIGEYFELDHLTCFHTSFMGLSEADSSFNHADVYATGEVGYNIIWPIMVVDGSKPELDIQAEDANVVVSVNYEYDVAYVLSDWGYHKTSPNDYSGSGQIRLVVGTYCAEINESNARMMKYLYDGEEPAPFMDQFEFPIEIHWGDGHSLPK